MAYEFIKRLIAPDKKDKHYYSTENIFFMVGYGMPNCTAYAWGRLYELTGKKYNTLCRHAGSWYTDAEKSGMKVGFLPKLGAVACWNGHVAIVEEIKENGDIVCSNSAWKSTEFYITEHTKASNYAKTGYEFQGFIYCGVEFTQATMWNGKQITLNNTSCYAQAYASAPYSKKSGAFFLWDNEVINGRVRITTQNGYVGVTGKVTCWVSVSDLGLTQPAITPAPKTIKVGDTVMLTNGSKWYDGKQPKDFVYTRKHKVKSITGDRAVITYLGIVAGACKVTDLILS